MEDILVPLVLRCQIPIMFVSLYVCTCIFFQFTSHTALSLTTSNSWGLSGTGGMQGGLYLTTTVRN